MITLERRGCRVTLRGPEGQYSVHDQSQVFTGMGWDAQAASALLVGAAPRSALLLGYGGGTVARQLRMMFSRVAITGVEIDAAVIEIARRHFALDAIGTKIVLACGEAFVARCRRSFDLVLDDMWDHDQQRPRAILLDPAWPASMAHRLTLRGVAAVNVFARSMDRREHRRVVARMKACFAAVTEVCLPWERVCVIAGSKQRLSEAEMHRAVARLPVPAQVGLGAVEMTPC